MNVALPILNDRLAPCFEAAREFILAEIKDNKILSRKSVTCSGDEGFHRIRLLRVHDVNTLICNGIKRFYLDLLQTIKIEVRLSSGGTIDEVLQQFLEGTLKTEKRAVAATSETKRIDLKKMVDWARDFFRENGYEVYDGPGQDSFLIDLIAELKCPRCGKDIRIAICCGAHTYSLDKEIQEFNYCSKATYNSRVFIYPGDETIARRCNEFGIELLKPFDNDQIPGKKCRVPLLSLPIEGHPELTA